MSVENGLTAVAERLPRKDWRRPGHVIPQIPRLIWCYVYWLRSFSRRYLVSGCKARLREGFWHALGSVIDHAWSMAITSALVPTTGGPVSDAVRDWSNRVEMENAKSIIYGPATPDDYEHYFHMATFSERNFGRDELFYQLDWLIPWANARWWIVWHLIPVQLLPKFDVEFWKKVDEAGMWSKKE